MIAATTARMFVVIGIALAGFFGPALAQQAPVQPQPTAASVEAAKELLALRGARDIFNPIIPGVVEGAKGIFLQQNPMIGKDLNEVSAKLRKELDVRTPELITMVSRTYASRFTEQELKDMLAFYRSPLGKKILVDEPAALQETLKAGQDFADQLSGEVMEKFRVEMKKKGHNL